MTPNGDGYFFSATKDTITVLKGADTLGKFTASATVIVDGDSIVISSDGVKQRYPVAGFDTIYAVDDVISKELILKSCNWIIMLLEDKYDITITGTGKQVWLNANEISAVVNTDLKMYWGDLQCCRFSNEILLSVIIGVTTIKTIDRIDNSGGTISEPNFLKDIHFNNTDLLKTNDAGHLYFDGLEFSYTENV